MAIGLLEIKKLGIRNFYFPFSIFFFLLFTIDYLLFSAVRADQSHLFALLERMEASYKDVRDYTALFRKQESINGERRPEEVSYLKFQKPFKVYMRWLPGPHEGREALYVEGANEGKVLIHEAHGFASFFSFLIDPGGGRVLRHSRYPFTEIGIGRLIERVGRDTRRAWGRRELRLVDHGWDLIEGRRVRQVEGILPQDPRAGYSSYRTILTIDEGSGLPIKTSIYDWDDLLMGEYIYSDLRLNPGLGEADFEPSNPAYNFSRWHISLSDGK